MIKITSNNNLITVNYNGIKNQFYIEKMNDDIELRQVKIISSVKIIEGLQVNYNFDDEIDIYYQLHIEFKTEFNKNDSILLESKDITELKTIKNELLTLKKNHSELVYNSYE